MQILKGIHVNPESRADVRVEKAASPDLVRRGDARFRRQEKCA